MSGRSGVEPRGRGRPPKNYPSLAEIQQMDLRRAYRWKKTMKSRIQKGAQFPGGVSKDQLAKAVDRRIYVLKYAQKAAEGILADDHGEREAPSGRPVRPVLPERKYVESDEKAKPLAPAKAKRGPTPMADAVAQAVIAAKPVAPPAAPPPPAGAAAAPPDGAPAAAATGGDLAAIPFLAPLFMPEAVFDVRYPKMPGQKAVAKGVESKMFKVTGTDTIEYARMEAEQALAHFVVYSPVFSFELYAELAKEHPDGFLPLRNWTHQTSDGDRNDQLNLKFATVFCKDGDLWTFVVNTYHSQGKAVPVELVFDVLKQILWSVKIMEKKRMRHQDIKCRNILWFAAVGMARIIDPGMLIRLPPKRNETVPVFEHTGDGKPLKKSGVEGTPGFMSSEAFYRADRIGNDRDSAAFLPIEMILPNQPYHIEIAIAEKLYAEKQYGPPEEKDEFVGEVLECLNRAGVLPRAFFAMEKLKPMYSDVAFVIRQMTKFHQAERLSIDELLLFPLFTNTDEVKLSKIRLDAFVACSGPVKFKLLLAEAAEAGAKEIEINAPTELDGKLSAAFPGGISEAVRTTCADRVKDLFKLANRLRTLDALKTQRNVSERDREILKQRHVVLNYLFNNGFFPQADYDRYREEDYGKDFLKRAAAADAARTSGAAAAAAERKPGGAEEEDGGKDVPGSEEGADPAMAFSDADGYDDEIEFMPMAYYASLSTLNKFLGIAEEEESSEWESSGDEEFEPEAAEGDGFETEAAGGEEFKPEPGEEFEPEPGDGDEFGPGAAAGSSAGRRRGGDSAAGAVKRQRTDKDL